jgi:hypothetical protein
MSQPPSRETPPDELLEAYRRASAQEHSTPSERVRAAIMACSKQPAARWDNAAEGHDRAQHPIAMGRRAANDSHWRWRVAASVAAVGLAGMLTWQTFLTPPHGAASTAPGSSTDQTARVAQFARATAPIHAPSAASSAAPSPIPAVAARPPAVAEGAAQQPAADSAVAAADATRVETSRAMLQSMSVKAARAASPGPRRDQVRAALRATLPELFAGGAATLTVRVAMVLNSDGTVYKIAREQPIAPQQADAASQIKQALGVRADELEAPAQLVTIDRSADQPNTIVVAVGVRGSDR